MSRAAELARELRARGTRRIFGIPGTQTVPFLEAARRESIDFTLAAHECGATFMAIGAARASGEVPVVCTIGGPGLTNALTGLIEARHDSAPMLHIVNGPAEHPTRSFLLQAIEHDALARNAVKAVLRLGPGEDAAATVEAAMEYATTGEPGPVLLELVPSDDGVTNPVLSEDLQRPGRPPEAAEWDQLTALWRQARRPVFYVGFGASSAHARLRRVAERYRVPVLTTPSGRGAIPESHDLALPFDPLRGHLAEANTILEDSDLVVALGCKLTHNGSVGFGLRLDHADLVHADPSASVAGRNYSTRLRLRASAGEVLSRLDTDGSRPGLSEWTNEELRTAREALRTPAPRSDEPRIAGRDAHEFFTWLAGELPDRSTLVTDSGQHQISTRRHWDVSRPGGLLFPADFQSMGFGLPAAIGHAIASDGSPTVALVGDGGFLMSGMETVTAVREGLPIPVIVFSDGHLGQIRLQQIRNYGHATGVGLGALHLEAFAEASGADYRLFDWQSPPNVRALMQGSGPTIVEVPVGDAPELALTAARQRFKGAVRQGLGEKTVRRLKQLIRGKPSG